MYRWRVKDSNLRRLSRRIYSPLPLATRATRRGGTGKRLQDGPRPSAGSSRRTPAPQGGGDVADSSFDVVSKVDRQEVDNALNQAGKELSQRFDFRGTNASIAWAGEEGVTLQADTEERVAAALDVFKEKLIKRGISLKALDAGEP